jgi:hypothetical protein
MSSRIGELQPALNRFLEHEQQGSEQNQIRNQAVEDGGGRRAHHHRSAQSAQQARDHQIQQAGLHGAQLAAVSEHSTQHKWPQRNRAGGIGGHRIEAQPDQRRKRDQGAAGGNGVDGAADESDSESYSRVKKAAGGHRKKSTVLECSRA